jgi:hypothetical protein
MQFLKYQSDSNRDERLDFLRGYAIIAMLITHAGIYSYWPIFTGNAQFIIGEAEGFFFISGMTLGIVAQFRPLRTSVERLLQRTWEIYLLVISLGFFAVSLKVGGNLDVYGEILINNVQDFLDWFVGLLTLQRSLFYSNILISFILYLGVAPVVVWGLKKDKLKQILLAILGMYLLSQLNLKMTTLPFSSFRDFSTNSPIFFIGLIIGYQRNTLSQNWQNWKYSKIFDSLAVILGISFWIYFVTDFPAAPILKRQLFNANLRRTQMPLVNLLGVFLYLRFFWLVVTYLWKPLNRILGWLFLPLGRVPLFSFMLHILVTPLVLNIPYFQTVSIVVGSLWNLAFVLLMLFVTKIRTNILDYEVSKPKSQQYFSKHLPRILAAGALVLFLLLVPWSLTPDEIKQTGNLGYILGKIWRFLQYRLIHP